MTFNPDCFPNFRESHVIFQTLHCCDMCPFTSSTVLRAFLGSLEEQRFHSSSICCMLPKEPLPKTICNICAIQMTSKNNTCLDFIIYFISCFPQLIPATHQASHSSTSKSLPSGPLLLLDLLIIIRRLKRNRKNFILLHPTIPPRFMHTPRMLMINIRLSAIDRSTPRCISSISCKRE